MYRLISVLLLLISSSFQTANGQSTFDTINILKQIIRPQNDTLTFLYTERVDTFFLNNMKRVFSEKKLCGSEFIRYGKYKKRCITLTQEERLHVVAEVERYKQPYWEENLFPDSKVVSLDRLNRIRDNSDTLSLKEIKHKQSSLAVHQFTKPIFFHSKNIFVLQRVTWWIRNKSFQIAAISYDLATYKLDNGIWKRWIVIEGGTFDF
jgi:hypothetical protein